MPESQRDRINPYSAPLAATDAPDESPPTPLRELTRQPQNRLTENAQLLMRLLGLYFLAWAVIEIVHIGLTINLHIMNFGVSREEDFALLIASVLQAVFGLYCIIGGNWVVQHVLLPAKTIADEEHEQDVEE